MEGMLNVVEACSGISALSQGYVQCGAKILCHVESNPTFAQWLRTKSKVPCVQGEVSSPATVAAVASIVQASHFLSAGISRQPFSGLGDCREQYDPRSTSCPGAILMGFWLGSVAFVLECTKHAFTSPWVQNMLEEFAMDTKYQIHQTVWSVHPLRPAKRDRWWCIVSHPALNLRALPDLPALPPHQHHAPLGRRSFKPVAIGSKRVGTFCSSQGRVQIQLCGLAQTLSNCNTFAGLSIESLHARMPYLRFPSTTPG